MEHGEDDFFEEVDVKKPMFSIVLMDMPFLSSSVDTSQDSSSECVGRHPLPFLDRLSMALPEDSEAILTEVFCLAANPLQRGFLPSMSVATSPRASQSGHIICLIAR